MLAGSVCCWVRCGTAGQGVDCAAGAREEGGDLGVYAGEVGDAVAGGYGGLGHVVLLFEVSDRRCPYLSLLNPSGCVGAVCVIS